MMIMVMMGHEFPADWLANMLQYNIMPALFQPLRTGIAKLRAEDLVHLKRLVSPLASGTT